MKSFLKTNADWSLVIDTAYPVMFLVVFISQREPQRLYGLLSVENFERPGSIFHLIIILPEFICGDHALAARTAKRGETTGPPYE